MLSSRGPNATRLDHPLRARPTHFTIIPFLTDMAMSASTHLTPSHLHLHFHFQLRSRHPCRRASALAPELRPTLCQPLHENSPPLSHLYKPLYPPHLLCPHPRLPYPPTERALSSQPYLRPHYKRYRTVNITQSAQLQLQAAYREQRA